MTKDINIIFAGLDFGGKTSIIKIIKQKQSAFEASKPTKGTDHFSVNILDCCFNEWDLEVKNNTESNILKIRCHYMKRIYSIM